MIRISIKKTAKDKKLYTTNTFINFYEIWLANFQLISFINWFMLK